MTTKVLSVRTSPLLTKSRKDPEDSKPNLTYGSVCHEDLGFGKGSFLCLDNPSPTSDLPNHGRTSLRPPLPVVPTERS